MIGKYNSLEFSLYIHIPFCSRKCDYCHFYVVPDRPLYHTLLLEGIRAEWNKIKFQFQKLNCVSIYFGGGTPSLLTISELEKILSMIRQDISLDKDIEITIEANPEKIEASQVQEWARLGINRVSIGVQSFDPINLKHLSRQHDESQAAKAVYTCVENGIDNVSIDLMYDLPSQTLSQWEHTLRVATSLPITHLSLYNLTIEPHTVFHKYRNTILPKIPADSVSTSMYMMACQVLEEHSLHQYEISAFAKSNLFSRHNTGYWKARQFWGMGPSAFSYWNGSRFKNIANLHRYRQQLLVGGDCVDFRETLNLQDRIKELLAVQIRLVEGIDLTAFQQNHGKLGQETFQAISSLEQQALVVFEQDRLHLTPRGRLFYDTVAIELI